MKLNRGFPAHSISMAVKFTVEPLDSFNEHNEKLGTGNRNVSSLYQETTEN
jgi:hypothetical protein